MSSFQRPVIQVIKQIAFLECSVIHSDIEEVNMWKVVLTLLLWATEEYNAQECPSSLQSSNFKFSIASKRNKTGHLVAQVKTKT